MEIDGICIREASRHTTGDDTSPCANGTSIEETSVATDTPAPLLPNRRGAFVLDVEEEHQTMTRQSPSSPTVLKMLATRYEDTAISSAVTSTLNPLRPPTVLDLEVLELLSSQMKQIAGLAHRHLIEATGKSMVKVRDLFTLII